MPMTSSPLSRRALETCMPMKPAAPVTSIFIFVHHRGTEHTEESVFLLKAYKTFIHHRGTEGTEKTNSLLKTYSPQRHRVHRGYFCL